MRFVEWRSSLENPQTPLSFPAEWLLDIFNGGRTDSGIRVSEMTALQVDAVLACVNIICNGVASLPLHVFMRTVKGGREGKIKAHDHPLYDLLRGAPNEEMTSHTFRKTMQCHALLWGNAYAEIQRNGAAQPIALWPRNPARTRPVRLTDKATIEGTVYPRGTLIFHTSETMGDEISAVDDSQNRIAPERIILAEDMLHVPGLSLDGRLGQSTVYLSRQIIGLSLATEKYAAKFFGNGAVPRGVLTIPSAMESKELEVLRRSWQEAYGGENAQKTAILEAGMEYKPIGIDPEKSQFVDTRHFQRSAIAAIFSVPLHMIGEKEAAKSSVEQTSIEFLNYCLNPWLDAWEQEFKRKLFVARSANYFAKFDVQRLLYPDAASRAKFYSEGKVGGWLNSNDIHQLEDMNPITDGSGEIYWMPVNMQDAAHPITAPHMSGGEYPGVEQPQKPENPTGGAPQNRPNKNQPPPKKKAKRELLDRYERAFAGLFRDAYGRLWHRFDENGGIADTAVKRCFDPILHAMVNQLCAELNPGGPDTLLMSGQFASEIAAQEQLVGAGMYRAGDSSEVRADHACQSLRQVVEYFAALVDWRYNPNHSQQPRHPDGTFHDGSMPFYLGRHATTQDDVDGVWSGRRDVQVTPEGEGEIDETIKRLQPLGIKRVVCSPLMRTQHTAQRYADALGGLPLSTDWRLAALNLGELEGMKEKENAGRLQVYIDNPDTKLPGSDESVNDYVKRVDEAIDELRSKNKATGPILAISHSSAISNYLEKVRGTREDLEHSPDLLSPAGAVQINGKKVQVVAGKITKGDAA